jgi:hypothetical protein
MNRVEKHQNLDVRLEKCLEENGFLKGKFFEVSKEHEERKMKNEARLETNVKAQIDCYLFELSHLYNNDPEKSLIEDSEKYIREMDEDINKYERQIKDASSKGPNANPALLAK